MSNLVRWNPVRDLVSMTDAMDRLFDDAFILPRNGGFRQQLPALDVVENGDTFIVHGPLISIELQRIIGVVKATLMHHPGSNHQACSPFASFAVNGSNILRMLTQPRIDIVAELLDHTERTRIVIIKRVANNVAIENRRVIVSF